MTTLNTDQMLGLVVASGAPKTATDQMLALVVEQRLVPATIYTRTDQLLALIVEVRGNTGVLSTDQTEVVANGFAFATITAVVKHLDKTPAANVIITLQESQGSSIQPAISQLTDVNGIVTWQVSNNQLETVTYSAIGAGFTNTVTVQFVYEQTNGVVYSTRGPVVAGTEVWILNQPITTTGNPPAPLRTVYADAEATQVVTQPILTDGLGRYGFYTSAGLFAMIVDYGAQRQTYRDQEAGKPSADFHNIEWWCKTNFGPAVSGASIYILNNDYPNIPTTLGRGVPNPQVAIYSNSSGGFALAQPLATDSFGYASSYLPAQAVTVAVYVAGSLAGVYKDVSVGGVLAGAYARYHGWVRDVNGRALANARVLVSYQPTDSPVQLVPWFPTNLAPLYADVNGLSHIAQSLTYDSNGKPVFDTITTDGNGYFTFCIAADTIFTIAVYNRNALVYTLVDQAL